MRNTFGQLIADAMTRDPNVWLLTGDLGFGILNKARELHPDRALNVGAAEQLMTGAAVGLADSGKTVVTYSITPFVLYRPYEFIRNYLHHENVPVKLVGTGRGRDYGHLGFSHWAEDDDTMLANFPNIEVYKPETKEELIEIWDKWLYSPNPAYLNIRR